MILLLEFVHLSSFPRFLCQSLFTVTAEFLSNNFNHQSILQVLAGWTDQSNFLKGFDIELVVVVVELEAS